MPLWLVIGGVSSGKSAWAEQFIMNTLNHHEVEYIATLDESAASLSDSVLHQKLAQHRMRRPLAWTLWQEPDNPIGRILELPETHDVLWDGVGPYISRYMLRHGRSTERKEYNNRDFAQERPNPDQTMEEVWTETLFRISQRKADTVIVSEEAGLGLIPMERETYDFVRILGKFNQIASNYANGMIFVVAGLPLWLKGAPQ